MKTYQAVLLSTGLVLAMGGAAAYGVYRLAGMSKGAHEREVEFLAAERERSAGAVDEILAPARARLAATERDLLRIELAPMATDELKASKLGGRAYWAAGRDWPRDPDGHPLQLLAQIDLAQARLPGYPQQGLLQFFISGRGDYYGANFDDPQRDGMNALAQPRSFRVVHWPDASAPAVAPPDGASQAGQLPFEPGSPRRMRFSAARESIGANDARLPQVLGRPLDELAAAYAARHPGQRAEALSDAAYEALARGGHKLGGHPDFTQSDPREAEDRHVLLLQLDSDDTLMWGDSGIANFFIDPDDLERGEFDRVAYHWDCY
ncbi:YwqG family protein [Lysobacter silvisoli]|uniref:DUF1963 domain-containing protein n=1 Tax=Lysobacter silvisoli TaxID=2293254 RepID=A0A371K1Z2_9GAMM|nr:DUF1963 domain-containing protein [Lysobacter silvisoli]RDZ27857.1 DUF1963 domain-containing protein [Lysobacter silvisoli]